MEKIHITSLVALGAFLMAACGGNNNGNAGGGVIPAEQQGTPIPIAQGQTFLADEMAKIESGEIALPDVFTITEERNPPSGVSRDTTSFNKNEKRCYVGRYNHNHFDADFRQDVWAFADNEGFYEYVVPNSDRKGVCSKIGEDRLVQDMEDALGDATNIADYACGEMNAWMGEIGPVTASGYAPSYTISSLGAGHLYFKFSATMPVEGRSDLIGTVQVEGLIVNYLPTFLNLSEESREGNYSTRIVFDWGAETFQLPANAVCPVEE